MILLRVMHQILELKRDDIPADLALDLVGLGMTEMQREKVAPSFSDVVLQLICVMARSLSNRR